MSGAASTYARPSIGWIKRRARRIQKFYGVGRRLAVFDAMRDYSEFAFGRPARLVVIPGGKQA